MKPSFNIFIIISLLLTFATAAGQSGKLSAIDPIFDEWNHTDTPGGAVGIVQNGELIFAKGYGMADLEHDVKITSSSVFYIGSVSKQFVTFCILLLEEQGKLDLDVPIQRYLPDFPEYDAELTLRHFIHHTSGVRDYLTLMNLQGKSYLDEVDEEEVYELIKRQKELNFTPGEKYLYSNSCYFMLAMVVEKVSGEPIREFADKHVFKPLGMKNTQFYDDNTKLIKNRVFSYRFQGPGKGYANTIMRFDLVGSGGVYSTVEDLFLWEQNFYQNKLGKGTQAIIERMHEEGLLNNGKSSGYAFGLVNGDHKGLKTVSHSGSLAGYRANLLRFPEERFSVIILSNRSDSDPSRKAYQVADFMLHDRLEEKIITETNEDVPVIFSLEQIKGNYSVGPGSSVEIGISDGKLEVYQPWDKKRYHLKNIRDNIYHSLKDFNRFFEFSDLQNDKTQLLTIEAGGKFYEYPRKTEIKAVEFDPDDYPGNFYNDEIQSTFSITHDNDGLKIQALKDQPRGLIATDTDLFVIKGNLGTIQFYRRRGKIKGFKFDTGRVKNLKFEKSR
ncbi:serine hydrolase domain-containing protein [Robertkochia aurantiaca]|uniref:serine hydrolase domain-containing protein n=1 Tax=Robertkochia aurantiaca TaxID=2873700 RepID=UPI001CCCFFB0|nr:serine hydrolase [Robertkochia sp. 3YJGBD-33]